MEIWQFNGPNRDRADRAYKYQANVRIFLRSFLEVIADANAFERYKFRWFHCLKLKFNSSISQNRLSTIPNVYPNFSPNKHPNTNKPTTIPVTKSEFNKNNAALFGAATGCSPTRLRQSHLPRWLKWKDFTHKLRDGFGKKSILN